MNILAKLMKAADLLDRNDSFKEADKADQYIFKFSNEEPTDEDLLEVEKWLEESGINTGDEPGSSLEDELNDLALQLDAWKKVLDESEDEDVRSLAGSMVDKLKEKVMYLSAPLLSPSTQIIEACLDFADTLDKIGMNDEADRVDSIAEEALSPKDVQESLVLFAKNMAAGMYPSLNIAQLAAQKIMNEYNGLKQEPEANLPVAPKGHAF